MAQHLRGRGFPVRALTRHPESEAARALENEGVEVVAGDFNDVDSLRRAVEGVYGVFSMSTFSEQGIEGEIAQGKTLADVADRADVTHYVYTSVAGADQKTGVPHFDSKYVIEEYIRGLGFAYTSFLRPVFFMENWLGMKDMINGGHLYQPLSPHVKLQQVATSDIGAFAALAFEHRDKWKGRALQLAGDDRSMTDIAAAFTRKLGRQVDYVQVSWDQFEKQVGPELTVMFRWFEEHGYTANPDELRAEYSGLMSFDQWLSKQTW